MSIRSTITSNGSPEFGSQENDLTDIQVPIPDLSQTPKEWCVFNFLLGIIVIPLKDNEGSTILSKYNVYRVDPKIFIGEESLSLGKDNALGDNWYLSKYVPDLTDTIPGETVAFVSEVRKNSFKNDHY